MRARVVVWRARDAWGDGRARAGAGVMCANRSGWAAGVRAVVRSVDGFDIQNAQADASGALTYVDVGDWAQSESAQAGVLALDGWESVRFAGDTAALPVVASDAEGVSCRVMLCSPSPTRACP